MTRTIKTAKELNDNNKEIMIAYLHFLHMVEHLERTRRIKAHWVGAYPRQHWIN